MEIKIKKTQEEIKTLDLPFFFKEADNYFMIKSEKEIIKVCTWNLCPSIGKYTIVDSHYNDRCKEIDSVEFMEQFEYVNHILKGMIL